MVLGILLLCSVLISLKLFFSLHLEDLLSHSIDDWNISNVVYDGKRAAHKQSDPGDFLNFQQAVAENTLPASTDITIEDLFENNSFDTGSNSDTSCTDPLCPTTSLAITTDPLLDCMAIDCPCGEEEAGQAFLAVKLESTVHSNYRKKLNLVIAIDISKYMARSYSHAPKGTDPGTTKMDVLVDFLDPLFSRLLPDEQLAIVLFSTNVTVAKTLRNAGSTNMNAIVKHLQEVQPSGEPNFQKGLEAACSLVAASYAPDEQWDNRVVVFLASKPAMSDEDFKDKLTGYANVGIQLTFVGLGMGLDSKKLETISSLYQVGHYRAATVDSFRQLMSAEGFDAMTTPLASNLRLHVKPKTDGVAVEALYHNSGLASTISTLKLHSEQILTARTFFAGQVRQNLVLFRLKHMYKSAKHRKANGSACMITSDGRAVVWRDDRSPVEEEVELHLTYQDHSGANFDRTWSTMIRYGNPPRFDNPGVRKAVLLQRYSTLMRSWLLDAYERAIEASKYNGQPHQIMKLRLHLGHQLPAHVKELKDGTAVEYQRKFDLGTLHKDYSILMNSFLGYLCEEAAELDDPRLLQDGLVLQRLLDAHRTLENRKCVQKLIDKR